MKQSYPNFEVVVVDDNSTDRTLQILRALQKKYLARLKVISVRQKPSEWAGKTWASQQGYLQSKGDVLLFTDGDSRFEDCDTVALSIRQMMVDKLDVLTGVPYLPLIDFWSKIVMPVWNLYSEVFGRGIGDANDPKSSVAFVMGSFFMVKRDVFMEVGTYESVRREINEDKLIGALLKKGGYKVKMFKIDRQVSALWSRNLLTLWQGLKRTIAPVAIERKSTAISQQVAIFVMVLLPFLLLPFTIMLAREGNFEQLISAAVQSKWLIGSHPVDTVRDEVNSNMLFQQLLERSMLFQSMPFIADVLLCILVLTAVCIKGITKYRLVPVYFVFCLIGAVFLIAAYTCSVFPILFGNKTTFVQWRGRSQQLMVSKSPMQQES
jgi:cellulose synthase/poly-beta-1,6-N-acetylglucosamine synthase-like glycosyltransferase